MKKTELSVVIALVGICLIALTLLLVNSTNTEEFANTAMDTIPLKFTTDITNPYFTLIPGTKTRYMGETEDGIETAEFYVTDEIKIVNGVSTRVVWDRVWLNGELKESTKDWFAQDQYGNVWYLGEDSKDYINGQVRSTKGSWEAGVDGAKEGIIMKAAPVVGEEYRQEYYVGVAEDMAKIISVSAEVKIADKTYMNCLQTLDWNPLETGSEEYKYYCKETGGLVYETVVEDGESIHLTSIEYGAQPTQEIIQLAKSTVPKITEDDAKRIASEQLNGFVKGIAIEKKFGTTVYVVEMDANGQENDVIIDYETGTVLMVEN